MIIPEKHNLALQTLPIHEYYYLLHRLNTRLNFQLCSVSMSLQASLKSTYSNSIMCSTVSLDYSVSSYYKHTS